MKKIFYFSITLLFLFNTSCDTLLKSKKSETAQKTETKDTIKVAVAPKPIDIPEPKMSLPSGLEYQIIKRGKKSSRLPVLNDHIEMHLSVHMEDSTIFESRKMNNNKPVPFQISKPKFKADPIEGFMMLAEGDSALFWVPVDSLKKSGNQVPDWMKDGKKIEYHVVMVSIKSDSELKRETQIQEAAQKEIDEKMLQDYFAKNNLKPSKTSTGLYYTISKEGSGELPKRGSIMSVFYTGKFINGNVFDSNQDSTFHHPEPFKVEVGKGKVIKGWDEGLGLLKKGSIGTLYIPSYLAYGTKERGTIPANSILIFDMDVRDIETQEEIDSASLNNYFKEHKLKPLKTKSGLYYTITKKGKGPLPTNGQTVSVKYTGKLIDGTTFDSNVDTSFHHTEPFSFELGKGRVIRGWDEGIALLNKGAKATLYIPSTLAYGGQRQGKIMPNSVLFFDVELLEIK